MQIADYARQIDADLIVIPSHGYTGIMRLLLGSVTERTIRYAHCRYSSCEVSHDMDAPSAWEPEITTQKSIKVLLTGPHQRFRGSVHALLESRDDIHVLAVAEIRGDVVHLIHDLQPDVIVMDAGPPIRNCLAEVRQLIVRFPGARVIALCMHADRQMADQVLEVGAAGYVLKDCAYEELVPAIHAVLDGQTHVSPGVKGSRGERRAPTFRDRNPRRGGVSS